MLRRVIASIGLIACLGQAAALTAETVQLEAGATQKAAADLSPVWRMKCPTEDRLVGLRLHQDERIGGVEAICARIKVWPDGVRWASAPALPKMETPDEPASPESGPKIVRVIERQSEGTILSADSRGVTRRRGSRAVVISIERPADVQRAEPEAERLEFRSTHRSVDLMCPQDRFVGGIRVGSERGRATERLAAIQLLCSDGTAAAPTIVGSWPAITEASAAGKPSGRRKKSKAAKGPRADTLHVQRIECRRSEANPHDGEAARAVFGTLDDGRVTTIGLSCARTIGSTHVASRTYMALRDWSQVAGRALGWSRRFEAPRWLDGTELASCVTGQNDSACAAKAADAFCTGMPGYAKASHFEIGARSSDAISPDGQRCLSGSCRTFAAITCSM